MVSLHAALQLLFVLDKLILMGVPALLNVNEALAVHPLTSVTVTVYVAIQTLDNDAVPGQGTKGPLEDQQYVYGEVPPEALAVMVLVQAVSQLMLVLEIFTASGSGGSSSMMLSLTIHPLTSVMVT